MTRPISVTLCPGAQARGDGIGTDMGAGTSSLCIRSVLLSNILLS